LSVRRQTGRPSIFTFMEKLSQVALPLKVPDLTPPAVPDSSPVLGAKYGPLTATGLPPSTLTVLVPLRSCLEKAMLG